MNAARQKGMRVRASVEVAIINANQALVLWHKAGEVTGLESLARMEKARAKVRVARLAMFGALDLMTYTQRVESEKWIRRLDEMGQAMTEFNGEPKESP